MTFQSSSAGNLEGGKSLNRGAVKPQDLHEATMFQTASEWDRLDQELLRIQDHPRAAAYREVSTKARSILRRVEMSRHMPGGFPAIEHNVEELANLYDQALIIRAEIVSDRVKDSLGVPRNKTLDQVFEPEVERALDALGPVGQKLKPELDKIVRALGVNPVDVLKGSVSGNRFFAASYGKPVVDFRQVAKAKETLEALQKAGTVSPALGTLANRLGQGIAQLSAIDPLGYQQYEWYQQNFAGKRMNWEPLRIVGALTGTLVSALGLTQTLRSKEHEFSPATAGWMAATLALVRPSLFTGGFRDAVNMLSAMGSESAYEAVASGFHGELASRAVEELQSLPADKSVIVKSLIKAEKPIAMAQIGEIAGANSALARILAPMDSKARLYALQAFGRRMGPDETELAKGMLAMA